MSRKPPERLYFDVRDDIPTGRAMAQAVHAMDEWSALYGPQQGAVVIYAVRSEDALLDAYPLEGRRAIFHEPDLGDEATAFATDVGPLELPLYRGQQRGRRGA